MKPLPLIALALAPALSAPAAAQEAWFREEADAAGLRWVHQSGARPGRYWFPEIMGGGLALLDYDNDGDLDVYLVQSGRLDPEADEIVPTNRLFRNMLKEKAAAGGTETTNGNSNVPDFVDVTEQARVGHAGYGNGAAAGDYDGDGWFDLYVTNVGPNVLYHNDGIVDEDGDGVDDDGIFTFTDVTDKMKVGDYRWATSAAFFDADGDGDQDLFCVNNLNWEPANETPCNNYRNQPDYCSPNNYNAHSTDALFIQGRLGFLDSSRQLGLHLAVGNGLGVACTDFDLDGDVDVYVANDATPNALWRNDGKDGFENIAVMAGCAVNAMGTPEAGMGVQWVDVNQDGLPDLFMTHIRGETNTFYLNRKRGDGYRFSDRTPMTGLGTPSTRFTGFGMAFHDYDHDGKLDLYVANGAVQAWGPDEDFDPNDPYAEPNHLYRGLGGTRFELLGEGTTAPVIGSSRGAAFGDLDEDGDVDILVVDRDAPVKLLRNIAPKKGGWIGFRALTTFGADATGGALRLTTHKVELVDGQEVEQERLEQWRYVHHNYSYQSSNDPRVHFGIPEGHTVVSVAVRWPGTTAPVDLGVREAGQYHVLRQRR